MKKSTFASLLLTLVIAYSSQSFAQWVKTSEPSGAVFSLGVSGTSLLAGTLIGVFRSTDYGDTWHLTLPYTVLPFVQAFALDPIGAGSNNLYAGGQGGVYLSSDDGLNWQAFNSGLENKEVRSLTVIPDETEGSTLLAGTTEGVFRSTNNGVSWILSGLTNWIVYALIVFEDEMGNTIVLAGIDTEGQGIDKCIYRSTDKGVNWTAMPLSTYWAGSFVLIPNETGELKIFAGTYSGVYLSTNNGTNWTQLNAGPNRSVYSLAISQNEMSGTNLFAGTFLGGVFQSNNNGVNWTAINTGLPYENDYIFSLAILGQYIFAGTANLDGGVWRRPLSELVTSVEVTDDKLPTHFSLLQNYPNPFNPSTTISYTLSTSDFVSLKVYDVLGNEVAILVDEEKPAGSYEVEFDATDLSSGIYFYQLQAGSFIETKKMILMK